MANHEIEARQAAVDLPGSHARRDSGGEGGAVTAPFKVGDWVAHAFTGLVGRVVGTDVGNKGQFSEVEIGRRHPVEWYWHNTRLATPDEVATAKGEP